MRIKNPVLRFLMGLAIAVTILIVVPYALGSLVLYWGDLVFLSAGQGEVVVTWCVGVVAEGLVAYVALVGWAFGEWLFGRN